MNVFILTTGRTGSLTFAEACRHVTNYTSSHESRVGLLGDERLAYPDQHIEIDPRLGWFSGRLEEAFGDDAYYVHLLRDEEATATSWIKRWKKPGMRSYRNGILWDVDPEVDRMAMAHDYLATVNGNIEFFLRDKSRTLQIHIENAVETFPEFWEGIGAEGDLDAALAELETKQHEGGRPREHERENSHETTPKRKVKSWRLPRLRRP
jgi:hypothetical protein